MVSFTETIAIFFVLTILPCILQVEARIVVLSVLRKIKEQYLLGNVELSPLYYYDKKRRHQASILIPQCLLKH